MVPIFRPCSLANSISSGRRAMVPSSFMISQITEDGSRPAMPARSQPASVWPARTSTPPSRAVIGKTWPGCTMSSAVVALGDGDLDGARAVGGGNAGGDALGSFDGNREGGAVLGLVVARHLDQAELLAARFGQGQADQAAAMLGHEVDGFRRHVLGGHDEVALVFAVLFVDQDDHAARLQFGDDFSGGGDGGMRGHVVPETAK